MTFRQNKTGYKMTDHLKILISTPLEPIIHMILYSHLDLTGLKLFDRLNEYIMNDTIVFYSQE